MLGTLLALRCRPGGDNHALTRSAGRAAELVCVMTLEHDALFRERTKILCHK